MQRIANGTQVSSLPTRAAPVGTPGYGTNGDPGAGQLGSVFGADEYNPLQEELMAFLTAAGITPDGNNNAQVIEAVRQLFAPHMQVFDAGGTFNVPSGITLVKVCAWGAGGGGGGCSAAGAARGGGGGEFRAGVVSVTPGATITCTVGAGGAGGTNAPTSGAAGGSSSFGALVTAVGGAGGSGSGGGVATGGGTGGIGGSGGSFVLKGASSELSYAVGSSFNNSVGGGCFGAGYGAFVVANNGNDGWTIGVGGSGGANGAGLGGNGGGGRIIVEW